MTFRKILHWLRQLDAWLIWPAIGVVIWGQLAPPPAEVEVHVWDKALHFIAYFGLSLMATLAVRADRRALWWAAGFVLQGILLEFVQGMVGRDAELLDAIANTMGVVAGLGLGAAGVALLKSLRLVDDTKRD